MFTHELVASTGFVGNDGVNQWDILGLESRSQCMHKCLTDRLDKKPLTMEDHKFCQDLCKDKPNNCHGLTCDKPGDFGGINDDNCKKDELGTVSEVNDSVRVVRDALSAKKCKYAGKADCSDKKGCTKLYLKGKGPTKPKCYTAFHSAKISCDSGTCIHIPGIGGKETDEGSGFKGVDKEYAEAEASEFWECPCH